MSPPPPQRRGESRQVLPPRTGVPFPPGAAPGAAGPGPRVVEGHPDLARPSLGVRTSAVDDDLAGLLIESDGGAGATRRPAARLQERPGGAVPRPGVVEVADIGNLPSEQHHGS